MRKAIGRNQRILKIVELLRRGQYPNATKIRNELRAESILMGQAVPCIKTINRDFEYLRFELEAPIEYDFSKHGYYLKDDAWIFPYKKLESDKLFAALFSEAFARKVLPNRLAQTIQPIMQVQLAAGDPGEIPTELFSSLITATSAVKIKDFSVFDVVNTAWREGKQLEVSYLAANKIDSCITKRMIDIHAIFLCDGAWYARVFCHLRKKLRSLAIHRMHNPKIMETTFERNLELVDQVRRGENFTYPNIMDVKLVCTKEKAAIIREREWFPSQIISQKADGSLRLEFSVVPRDPFIWWVLSYAGHLIVEHPPELVGAIQMAASNILENHCCSEDKTVDEILN